MLIKVSCYKYLDTDHIRVYFKCSKSLRHVSKYFIIAHMYTTLHVFFLCGKSLIGKSKQPIVFFTLFKTSSVEIPLFRHDPNIFVSPPLCLSNAKQHWWYSDGLFPNLYANANVARFGFYNRVEENLCLATTMEEIIDLLAGVVSSYLPLRNSSQIAT